MGLGPSVVEVLVELTAVVTRSAAAVLAVLEKIEANTRGKKDK
jgi:hypothetical protein